MMISQSINQPRVVNRIEEYSKLYDNVQVYTFVRSIYDVDNFHWLKNVKNINIQNIGKIDNKKYIFRLFLYLKLFFKILWNSRLYQEIYVFGLDLGCLVRLLPFSKFTYEISDIIWLYKKGVLKEILKKIDYSITKKANKVVFTSKGFYFKYYSTLNESKVIIKENKFRGHYIAKPIKKIRKDKVSIAYIGAFRYNEIIKSLLETCISFNIEINFYGDGPEHIINEIKSKTNEYSFVKYWGAFKNPDDLTEIYKTNNLNFVVYNNQFLNEQVAMPNKFYESGYFNIPILCATSTYVGDKVVGLGMGWVIDTDKNAINRFLSKLTLADLINCHNNIKKLDKRLFIK